MEFIILIFINIIMGTFFYLILRLRLEKHASDYREKRLKREIDEIISVFNETAERNITILENRIEYLKKLMEKSGVLDNIDFRIDDSKNNSAEIKNSAQKEIFTGASKQMTDTSIERFFSAMTISEPGIRSTEERDRENPEKNSNSISRYYSQIKEKITVAFRSVMRYIPDTAALYNKSGRIINLSDAGEKEDNSPDCAGNDGSKVSHNFKVKNPHDASLNDDDIMQKSSSGEYSELKQMFSNSEDKYSLISDLFDEGYSPEVICECSGIPIGEIKLVLDLNSRA